MIFDRAAKSAGNLTLYLRDAIFPFSSIRNGNDHAPTVLPYIFFSPKVPYAGEHFCPDRRAGEVQLPGVAWNFPPASPAYPG